MNKVLTPALKAIKIDFPNREYVSCSREGTPYRSFRTSFECVVRKSGIDWITFHDLPQTFARPLVMRGADLATVKELMEHRHINVTLRYTRPSSDHKQRAVSVPE